MPKTFQKGFGTKRRIMRSFKMIEISGVDRPAQEGAKIVITKRAPDDAESFAKASFREIMDQKERERSVSEAFYEAFEDQWTANDAFRQALSDSYQSGEEAARQYVETIAEMAREAVSRIKGTETSDNLGKALYFSAVAEAAQSFTKRQEAPMYKSLAALKAAIAKYQKDGGDAAELKTIQKSAIDLDATAELTGDLALAPAADPKPDPEVAKMARELSVLKLSTDARAHFDGLDATAQDAFLAKSADEQRADVEMAKSADPVLYTCADGTAIRKSDGPAVLSMAKRADKLEADLAKANAANEDATFAKRARDEFGYLPAEGTAEMLKAAEAMTDPDKKKKMLDAMRAANTAAAKKHRSIGSAGPDDEPDGGEDASDALDNMAKAYAEKNSVSLAKAYDAVLQTEEGAALYAKSVGHPQAEDA